MARSSRIFTDGIILVLAGPPGCGKGTYGKILAERWGSTHLSIGELIRSELGSSLLDADSQARAARGLLLSDSIAAELCRRHIRSSPTQRSWILDGFPRTIRQAYMLREFASPHACVNFHVRNDVIVKKLLSRRVCKICGGNFNLADIREFPYDMPAILPQPDCRKCKGNAPLLTRTDDTQETIQKRLDIYEKSTRPVIEQYDAEGILLNFEVLKGIQDMTRLETTLMSFLLGKYGGNGVIIGGTD